MRYLLLFVMATLTAVGQSTKPDPNIVWFPDGGYACGHPDQPSTTPCRMPTDTEIAAHMPKKHKAHPGFKQTPCANLAASDVQIQDSGKCYVPIKKLDFIYICSPCATSHLLQFENPVDDGVAHWQAPKPPVPEAIKEGTICDHLPETQKITCLMNLVAPEKAVVREWKSDSCWMPNTTTDACKLDPMSCLEWLEHCPAGGVPGLGADQKPEGFSPDGGCNWCQKDGPCTLRACPKTPESKLQYGWLVPDPIKTAQDGYDCTMDRTLKTITISCTLKEPK